MGEMSLGDALHNFLEKSKLKEELAEHRIELVWEELMGKTIARYTQKIELVNKTLFIQTHIAALKQEIGFQKDKLLSRLNEILGEGTVKEIIVR